MSDSSAQFMTSPSTSFTCFSGTYVLERNALPAPQQPLQAWDAADEYLLSAVAELLKDKADTRVLIVNDQFGALAVGIQTHAPDSWGDSCVARWAMVDNLRRNNLPDSVTFVPSTMAPGGKAESAGGDATPGYDVVLWRVPKVRAFFERQLAALSPLLSGETLVLAGGMVKHLSDSAKEVLSRAGSVRVYPVQKKAVLLHLTPQPDLLQAVAGAETPETRLVVPEYGLTLAGGPNVFAREKFDIGARFFLEQFAQLPRAERIVDLGCGNGILGIVAKRLQPSSEVHFFDESYQAVAAAEANYRRNVDVDADEPMAQFHVDDGLTHYAGEAFDLVLCNPPFHQAHTIGDQTAMQMFAQSHRHLRSGGELWIVGNRHLEYHVKLRRVFGNYRQVAAHPKFVVLAAVKR